VNNSTLLV